MTRFAALVRENKERLHWLDAIVTGKDSTFGGFEIGFVADTFDCKAAALYLSEIQLTMRLKHRLRGNDRHV